MPNNITKISWKKLLAAVNKWKKLHSNKWINKYEWMAQIRNKYACCCCRPKQAHSQVAATKLTTLIAEILLYLSKFFEKHFILQRIQLRNKSVAYKRTYNLSLFVLIRKRSNTSFFLIDYTTFAYFMCWTPASVKSFNPLCCLQMLLLATGRELAYRKCSSKTFSEYKKAPYQRKDRSNTTM